MNINNLKNLLVIVAVLLVLAAGTILLGNYANNASESPKLCAATALAGCCGGGPEGLCGDDPNATNLCSDTNSK